ncbi:uncharacterized protein LOC122031170 isoform X1 [Zingiber officinale]|uniref:uncharacterized protein LOC122031170 isoform X1 n=1 Tax=Zingiber officinale TaxID=94328 RepID=UPI001C4DC7A7|nr:uncharacterized protein LOC122031170 isoform X1 [Zingiber officinale]XP_042446232.1 uncharacterized protein LOC122031170 isoform X1 [Zingiber officinale]XP_042446233.1 uncharacterized protein LOC122031170 isoform X1 [Zingiber officinale]
MAEGSFLAAADVKEGIAVSVASQVEVFFQRQIDFDTSLKPPSSFPSAKGNSRPETLKPFSGPGKSACRATAAAALSLRKRPRESEFCELELDPELSRRITFKRIGAGLANLGNTCFLNSVLQCLTYTEPFAAYLQSGKHKSSCHTAGFCAMCALQNHVNTALQSSGKIVSPSHLVKNLRCVSRSFRNLRQEDAHEYMVNLLESMHKCCLPSGVPSESPSAYEKSLVHKIFGGRLRSQVKCTQCTYSSNKFDPFLDLSLEIAKTNSLRNALTHFTAVEQLDGGQKHYHCQNCKEKVRALKQLSIHKPPHVLTIHLKRFSSYDPDQKIDKRVAFEPTLDLQPFVSDQPEGDLKYTLYGVLVHVGWSTHSGHYYCYVRTSSGIWHSLDDNQVHQVSEKTVLMQKAYMLFYVRNRSPIPKGFANSLFKDGTNPMGKRLIPNGVIKNGLIRKSSESMPEKLENSSTILQSGSEMDISSNVPLPKSSSTLNGDTALNEISKTQDNNEVIGVQVSTLQADGNFMKKELQQTIPTSVVTLVSDGAIVNGLIEKDPSNLESISANMGNYSTIIQSNSAMDTSSDVPLSKSSSTIVNVDAAQTPKLQDNNQVNGVEIFTLKVGGNTKKELKQMVSTSTTIYVSNRVILNDLIEQSSITLESIPAKFGTSSVIIESGLASDTSANVPLLMSSSTILNGKTALDEIPKFQDKSQAVGVDNSTSKGDDNCLMTECLPTILTSVATLVANGVIQTALIEKSSSTLESIPGNLRTCSTITQSGLAMYTSSNIPAPQSPYTILNRDASLDGIPEDQVTGVEISSLQEDDNCLKKESQQWTSTFVASSSSVVVSKNLVHQPFDEAEEGMEKGLSQVNVEKGVSLHLVHSSNCDGERCDASCLPCQSKYQNERDSSNVHIKENNFPKQKSASKKQHNPTKLKQQKYANSAQEGLLFFHNHLFLASLKLRLIQRSIKKKKQSGRLKISLKDDQVLSTSEAIKNVAAAKHSCSQHLGSGRLSKANNLEIVKIGSCNGKSSNISDNKEKVKKGENTILVPRLQKTRSTYAERSLNSRRTIADDQIKSQNYFFNLLTAGLKEFGGEMAS